jgi:AcrR family transcriptional regulator
MVQKELRARGRPRSFDADAVLDKARAVFWNLGYAATSLDDLAAATGLNRPSLYGAFGDKHALYIAALQRSRDESVRAMGQALSLDQSLREVLRIIYSTAIRVYRAGDAGQRGCFLIGTAVTQAVDDPEARDLLARFVSESDALFADRFARSKAELAAGADPEGAAAVAVATLHTLAIRARTGADEASMQKAADGAIALICGPA